MTAMLQKCKQKEKEQSSLFFAQACQGMAQFWISTLREDKAFFFLLRLCILILKVAKNVWETFFWGIELIRVELM